MKEAGRIAEIDPLRKTARVEIRPREACSHCSARSACNSTGEETKVVEANNPIGAGVGDWVNLEISENISLAATLLVFGIPLLFLIVGIVIGEIISGDRLALILGGSGLLTAFLLVKIFDKYLNKKRKILPTIISYGNDKIKY